MHFRSSSFGLRAILICLFFALLTAWAIEDISVFDGKGRETKSSEETPPAGAPGEGQAPQGEGQASKGEGQPPPIPPSTPGGPAETPTDPAEPNPASNPPSEPVPPPGPGSEREAPPGTEEEPPQAPPGGGTGIEEADLEDFKSSEKVPADVSVAFPIDI